MLRKLRRKLIPRPTEYFTRNPQQLERLVNLKWLAARHVSRPKAKLPAPVYISLTSYPARFPTLPATLKCLLMQSRAPDAVILWIAHADFPKLTPAIIDLKRFGLQIRTCTDVRSYNKIIPGLLDQPNAFWVTADDDCYYPPDWLQRLVDAWKPNTREVICHRAHRIRLEANGYPLRYTAWELEIASESSNPLDFMTGVGGVLYPPGSLDPQVTDAPLFKKLCAGCDDVWLWWMVRRAGYVVRKIGGPCRLITWGGSQATSLYADNVLESGNDVAIRAMVGHFGFPPP